MVSVSSFGKISKTNMASEPEPTINYLKNYFVHKMVYISQNLIRIPSNRELIVRESSDYCISFYAFLFSR